jgi:hypothetical protein
VEAVRVLRDGPAGPRRLLAEAWTRYRTPIAITEAHLGCTREDQMRWLLEVWNAARSLRAAGIPVVAVTETPSPAGASFEDWQVAQLTRLGQALAQATGR